MKIIDMHTHIGSWSCEGSYFSKEDLLNVLSANDVEFFCVSNLDCIDIDISKPGRKTFLPEKEGNMVLLKTFEKDSRAKLLLVCEPKYGNLSTIKQFLESYPNKFSGLKFHPEWHTIACNDSCYDGYMELAKEYNLPVLVHSGHMDSPYSSPSLIYDLAKRFPSVPVILGHLSTGGMSSKKEAVKILKKSIENKDANLYADISWCDMASVVSLLNKMQGHLDRIMFGSDAPLGNYINPKDYAKFVNDVKNTIEENFSASSSDILDKIFYSNAKNLFKI
jgi:predicted TIM-barrel fold metal-dependent hydrolase